MSELCALIGEVLDDSLAPSYWVKAEISSITHRGGHLFFELADKNAKMRATCWSGTQELLSAYFQEQTGQTLQAGMSILVEVNVQFHSLYGLSLSIIGIEPSFTLGQIALQRQRTIAQLEADGLMDAQQLLTLPTLVRKIAVISSPSAAGYEDFVHTLDRSPFTFHLSTFTATMQGDTAAKSIIAALEEIQMVNGKCSNGQCFDAVVIIRGGGATTDLQCFDDYTLCAVAAQIPIPIITGIGHTRDVAILDMIAHQALKTPTAVAEWLIQRFAAQQQRIDILMQRLLAAKQLRIANCTARIAHLLTRLQACNPQRILQRGYAVLLQNGQTVTSVHQLTSGDSVTVQLADGTLPAQIV